MIKSLPKEENPREKALANGVETLSNVELLALILRTGNKEESVLELAQRLLYEVGGMSQLSHINYAFLISLKGIKDAKAIEILSIIEIAKRLKTSEFIEEPLLSPNLIYQKIKDELMFLRQEHFVVLCLDNKNRILTKKTIFIGSINMSVVTPREVFKEAINVSSAKIILCHNHPSGDAYPSQEDIILTEHFEKLGEMMSIEVIDHIIVGWNQYFSVKANKLFKDKQ